MIRDSIIGEAAVIGEGSTIENGSLVGARTKIGTGAVFGGVSVGGEKPEVEGEPEGASRESSTSFSRIVLMNSGSWSRACCILLAGGRSASGL